MGKVDLKALQAKPIADISPALGDLDRDQLVELLALEADSNSPRETLTKTIAARLEKMDADDAEVDEPEPVPDGKHPAHHHPDYAGPLDVAQAAWRNRNLKPAKVAAKK